MSVVLTVKDEIVDAYLVPNTGVYGIPSWAQVCICSERHANVRLMPTQVWPEFLTARSLQEIGQFAIVLDYI